MATGARNPLQAPPAAPPRVGLIPAAIVNRGNESWEQGFDFLPENCNAGGVLDPCDNTTTKDIDPNASLVDVDPFVVWAGFKCSALGYRAEDGEARARRALAAVESAQVAAEFWTGALSQSDADINNRYLASPQSDVVSPGSALSLTNGLACLEQALAECAAGRGFVHATRQVVSLWHQGGSLRREGNLILTINDTIVVPDAGYDGTGPNGEAPHAGSVWAYATSPVDVRLSEVIVTGANPREFNRSVNTVEVRAERLAAVSFDGCCHIAVELDAPVCGIGGS